MASPDSRNDRANTRRRRNLETQTRYSERVGTENLPIELLAQPDAIGVAQRGAVLTPDLLDVAACGGRSVEEHYPADCRSAVLPGMRQVTREKHTGAGPAAADLAADPEGEFSFQHPRDLVAVGMSMEQTLGAGGQSLLEQRNALAGLVAQELQIG